MVIAVHNDATDLDRAVRLAYATQKTLAEFQALPLESQIEHSEVFWTAMRLARNALEVAFVVLLTEALEQVQRFEESYKWN